LYSTQEIGEGQINFVVEDIIREFEKASFKLKYIYPPSLIELFNILGLQSILFLKTIIPETIKFMLLTSDFKEQLLAIDLLICISNVCWPRINAYMDILLYGMFKLHSRNELDKRIVEKIIYLSKLLSNTFESKTEFKIFVEKISEKIDSNGLKTLLV